MPGRSREDTDEYNYSASPEYYGGYPTERPDGNEKERKSASPEALEEEFSSYLGSGERIKYVCGRGMGNLGAPTARQIVRRKKLLTFVSVTVVALILALFIALILMEILPFVLIFIMPIALIIMITAIAIVLGKLFGGADYAITNKRILKLQSGEPDQVSFESITDVSVTDENGNKGTVTVTSVLNDPVTAVRIMTLRDVDDPQRVKQIIEDSIGIYKASR